MQREWGERDWEGELFSGAHMPTEWEERHWGSEEWFGARTWKVLEERDKDGGRGKLFGGLSIWNKWQLVCRYGMQIRWKINAYIRNRFLLIKWEETICKKGKEFEIQNEKLGFVCSCFNVFASFYG